MDKYEFRVSRVAAASWGDGTTAARLNADGQQGWALVAATPVGDTVVVVMMRPTLR